MIHTFGPVPDPTRLDALQTAGRPLPLEEVARHVAAASSWAREIFVERREDGYVWSPAVRGGPAPLLRTIASLLGIAHTSLVVGGRAAGDYCVLTGDLDVDATPGVWTVLTFDDPATAEEIATRLAELEAR